MLKKSRLVFSFSKLGLRLFGRFLSQAENCISRFVWKVPSYAEYYENGLTSLYLNYQASAGTLLRMYNEIFTRVVSRLAVKRHWVSVHAVLMSCLYYRSAKTGWRFFVLLLGNMWRNISWPNLVHHSSIQIILSEIIGLSRLREYLRPQAGLNIT